ncbi:MAG: hypothetical protein ABL898_17185 [Hyphomicrobiaceae bacterium]
MHRDGQIGRQDLQPTFDQAIAARPLFKAANYADYCRFLDGLDVVRTK